MKNKVLINLYIVSINYSFDVYIPVNEYIGNITNMIISSAFELVDINPDKDKYYLMDADTGEIYLNSKLVRDTNIRNSKKIYLV